MAFWVLTQYSFTYVQPLHTCHVLGSLPADAKGTNLKHRPSPCSQKSYGLTNVELAISTW